MMVIGLTGGIASGKTTIARQMTEHGLVHVDADTLVHQLMQTPSVCMAIAGAFPHAMRDNHIDRQRLGEIVGKDPTALKTLEAILHPLVREAEIAAITAAKKEGKKGVILDIPLLFESGAESLCDVVIAASAPLELRKKRAFERPYMTEEKFARLIARQLTDEARNTKADHVIPTDQGLDFTRAQVSAILQQLKLA